jgi:hypothetical protein
MVSTAQTTLTLRCTTWVVEPSISPS